MKRKTSACFGRQGSRVHAAGRGVAWGFHSQDGMFAHGHDVVAKVGGAFSKRAVGNFFDLGRSENE